MPNNPRSRVKSVRGKPFETGNPGRPKGARNRTTVALEAMLEENAEAVVAKAVELALEGDRGALRLCMDRILAIRTERPVSVDLIRMSSAADGAAALAQIIASVAAGEITPTEALTLSQLVTAAAHAFESRDLENRLKKLEAGNTG